MDNDIKPLIELTFADNSFDDFYAYSITLDEGISKLYKAQIKILTVKPHSRADLKEILKKQVSVRIEQKFDNKTSCVRYLKGIVTSFQDKGVIFTHKEGATDRKNCSVYLLTVEPNLSTMNFVKKTRTFREKTPLEVIKNIGLEYDIQFEDACSEKPSHYDSKEVIFHQRNESDFCFFNRLLLAYGLNYYFHHDENGFEPKVYIANGKNFKPSSKIVYSSGKDAEDILLCCLSSSNITKECILLNKWEFSEQLCSDGSMTSSLHLRDLFEYDRSMSYGLEVITESLIKNSIETSFKYRMVDWVGESGHIALVPGTYLEVTGFSLSEDDNLSCLLRETSLHYTSGWPLNMALPPKEFDDVIPLYQSLRALEFGSVSSSGVEDCSFTLSSFVFEESLDSASSKYLDYSSTNKFSLFVATVSDNKGDTDNKGISAVCDEIDKNNPMRFYAVIDISDKSAVIANLVMPLGGISGGLYYFPKVGDRVLLTYFQGKYYLFGYLSNQSEFGDFYTGIRDDMIGSTILRKGFSDGVSSDKNKFHEIKMTEGSRDHIGNLIMYGTMDYFANKVITAKNDSSIRKAYESEPSFILDGNPITLQQACVEIRKSIHEKLSLVKTKTLDYDNSCKHYSEAADVDRSQAKMDMEKSGKDLESARRELDSRNNILAEISERIKGVFGVDDTDNRSGLDISSDTAINVTSKQEINQSTDKYTLTANNGIGISSENGEININSKKAINIVVGSNSIGLNQNGITIRSRKWASALGPFDSTILMDSINGTTIWGMNLVLKGMTSATMTDALGGSIGSNGGTVAIKGNTASIGTNTGIVALANLTNLCTQLIAQFTSISKSVPQSNAEYVKRTGDWMIAELNPAFTVKTMAEKYKGLTAGNEKAELIATGMIPQILNIIAAIVDSTGLFLESKKDPFVTKKYPNGMSGRDIIRLSTVLIKISSMGFALGGLISKMSLLNATSLALTKKYTLSTAEVAVDAQRETGSIGPTGGLPVDGPEGDEEDVWMDANDMLDRRSNTNSSVNSGSGVNVDGSRPGSVASSGSNRPDSNASVNVDGSRPGSVASSGSNRPGSNASVNIDNSRPGSVGGASTGSQNSGGASSDTGTTTSAGGRELGKVYENDDGSYEVDL